MAFNLFASSSSRLDRSPWSAAIVTLTMLVLVGWETRTRDPGGNGGDLHDRIKSMAKSTIPYSVGEWVGADEPVAVAAVEMLHPNVLVNRLYTNLRTGETASLLFVDCSDARDLLGHYPPICYPAHGYSLDSRTPRDWTVAGVPIQGVRYRFSRAGLPPTPDTIVDNFMVLPNGGIGRDMDAVSKAAADNRLHRLGAAEVQIVTDGTMTDARREEVFRALIGPTAPLLQSVKIEVQRD